MPSSKRPGALISAVVTSLAPALLILVALIVAMVVPRHATVIVLGGAAVAVAAYFYLLNRSRTPRGVRAGRSPRQRDTATRREAGAEASRWPMNSRRPAAADRNVAAGPPAVRSPAPARDRLDVNVLKVHGDRDSFHGADR
jgi:hypothetical protein